MIQLEISLEGDNAWSDLRKDFDAGKIKKGEIARATVLEAGMESGRPSVALIIEMENGEKVFAETSLRLFQSVAAAFRGKYGIVD